ncbi:hypothetical protein FNF27_00877 [Cafeteria roenbergensis]|uniref:Protein kinase domain-containing protein n=1 Tax=Cafeteria roenbergensis TaxID=33653 RepID=A0A5A8EIL7_CAFRO|nr:hypothetical protein FNF27_00877 [Cafeteria roenbergensis]
MGCVSSKGQPPASRGATGSRAAPPAVAVGPAAVAGHQPSAKADARRSPDDPIFTTKLAATGQPKELRSGLLAAIDVTGEGATRDYFIESNLGHGSFGEVFRARHRHQPSRTVALKVMARERIKVTSIQREFAVMEAMGSHPGIVGYHGCYKTPEKVTFVLELMNGGELFERLVHKGAYTEAEARPAFRRIARALAYLHSRGIVHRDLKPENLLLKEDSYTSEIKIADFGLSQLIRSSERLVKVCGTWAYAAPEMADAARPGYDTKFDTWGYGVILSVVLTGFHPFDPEGGLPVDTIKHRARNAIWDFDQQEWEAMSAPARDLIRRLIVKDPERRLSAAEMVEHPWLREHTPMFNSPGSPSTTSARHALRSTTGAAMQDATPDPDGPVVAEPFDPALWLTRTERVRSQGAPPIETIPPPGDPDDLMREAARYLAQPAEFGARLPRPGAVHRATAALPVAVSAKARMPSPPPIATGAGGAASATSSPGHRLTPSAAAVMAAAQAAAEVAVGRTQTSSRRLGATAPLDTTGAAPAAPSSVSRHRDAEQSTSRSRDQRSSGSRHHSRRTVRSPTAGTGAAASHHSTHGGGGGAISSSGAGASDSPHEAYAPVRLPEVVMVAPDVWVPAHEAGATLG